MFVSKRLVVYILLPCAAFLLLGCLDKILSPIHNLLVNDFTRLAWKAYCGEGNTSTTSPSPGRMDTKLRPKEAIIFVRHTANSEQTESDNIENVVKTERHEERTRSPLKTILYWTKCFSRRCRASDRGRHGFKRCKYNACTATNDRSKLSEASMVVFHHRDAEDLPETRSPDQLYVHFTFDPPLIGNHRDRYFDMFNDKINITVNYRQDADIYIPYGHVRRKTQPQVGPYIPKYPLRHKKGTAVWMVSHCGASSKRDDYVTELRKYIDVDIYGKCGNLSCEKSSECFRAFEKVYMFYLSFENNFCRDYFSEKLTRPLQYELVPIVLGLANYENIAPPHSVIDIREYRSPKHLAEYLTYLKRNEFAYYEYFQWKQTYEVTNAEYRRALPCKLCEYLHNSPYARGEAIRPSFGSNYTEWLQGACDNSVIDRIRATGHW